MEKNSSIPVYETLDRLGIPYKKITHEPVATMTDCEHIGTLLHAPFCKNLFLSNRQETKFYILLIEEGKSFKTAEVSKKIGSPRLSFGSPSFLYEYLGVLPGAITPLGLIHDHGGNVEVLFDNDLKKYKTLSVHACVNTESFSIDYADLVEKFIPFTHHEIQYLDINGN